MIRARKAGVAPGVRTTRAARRFSEGWNYIVRLYRPRAGVMNQI